MVQSRLLDIAVREFGAKGLEGASTRGIASAAGTAMSSITYHYGGKDGLYLAAADHISQEMAEWMADSLDAERTIAADDQDGARAGIHRILGQLADKMAGEESKETTLFVLREQMNPTEGFERIYAGIMGQMAEVLSDLICVATGSNDRQQAAIVTMTLVGQVLAMRASRTTLLRMLGIKSFSDEVVAATKSQILGNTDAILDRIKIEWKRSNDR